MSFTLAIAQCGFPDDGDVLRQVGRHAKEAQARGARILVFPEDLMSPRPLSADELRAVAQPIDGAFVLAASRIARDCGLWMVVTMYEADPAGGRPHNTAVVIDDAGTVRRTYRKCHLYDAHGVSETERTQPGDALCDPVDTPFCRLGLGICYDLRFPEVARAAALAGCDVLLYPSAWHDGPEKASHWETLLRARAIEEELFVVGACKAGERYVERSLVADPLGRVVAKAEGKSEQLLTCDIDLAQVSSARDAMPLLRHRRPELY